MSPLRLNGSTSGYSQLDAPAIAGDQTFTLPGTGGTLDRLNRAGNILQVVSTTKTDTFSSTTTGSWLDITGLSVSITPTSSSSKILVFAEVNGAGTNGSTRMHVRLVRDSTAISVGDAASNRLQVSGADPYAADSSVFMGSSIVFLDSPNTTSAITYKPQVRNGGATATIYVNRTQSDTDNNSTPRGVSSITVMEVAA